MKTESNEWPSQDVLRKLIEAAEILLHRMDYDGDEYEDISHCAERAKQHLQPQPAEDPDEWVIQDRVPPRVGVDEICWGSGDWHSDWHKTWSFGKMKHGEYPRFGGQLNVRCRRRDLPKVEQKKTTDDFGMYLESVIAKDPQLKAEVDAAEAELAAIDARLNKPEPQPQKTRVRLWLEVPTKMIMCRDKAPYGDWQEIHHDSEGFYVENQQ